MFASIYGSYIIKRHNPIALCRFLHTMDPILSHRLQPIKCVHLSLRWKKIPVRKPSWMPRANSKLFIIKPLMNIPEDELQQMKELHNSYRAEMRSIMEFCALENARNEGRELSSEDPKTSLSSMLMINQIENERVAKVRNEVLASELASEAQSLEKEKEVYQHWLTAKKEQVEKLVKNKKAESVNFINLENLDHAVEHAIDNPVNYNFAIDLNGQIHWEGAPYEGTSHWTDEMLQEKLIKPPWQAPRKPKPRQNFNFNLNKEKWA